MVDHNYYWWLNQPVIKHMLFHQPAIPKVSGDIDKCLNHQLPIITTIGGDITILKWHTTVAVVANDGDYGHNQGCL